MSTAIEWTDETWNPVTGCTKVSPGCDHCYAERLTERFRGKGAFAEIVLHPDRLDYPRRWRRPRMVFVNSMSDLFHDEIPDEYIAQVFAVMAMARWHTFQVLTKRPGRMSSLLRSPTFADLVVQEQVRRGAWPIAHGVLQNVWLGTSVESQKWADVRIPKLLETPAAVRFLSCEPLLGPVDLRGALGFEYDDQETGERIPVPAVDWVIAGGESGPGARPMHPAWARSLRDHCVLAGVPFFFKQWGEWTSYGKYHEFTHLLHQSDGYLTDRASATMRDPYGTGTGEQDLVDRGHPGWVRVRRIGKKAAGRELDGRTWDEMPQVAT